MKWFLGTDTARFNRRHKLSGHMFSGRYKTVVVDANSQRWHMGAWTHGSNLLRSVKVAKQTSAKSED